MEDEAGIAIYVNSKLKYRKLYIEIGEERTESLWVL